MKYQYDFDVKDDLLSAIQKSQNFSGAEGLRYWLNMYMSERDKNKKNLIKFCIYKYSSHLSDDNLKNFDCDVCFEVTDSYKKTYRWLNGYTCQEQQKSGKYELVRGNSVFRGDTMTSIWTILKEYIKLKTAVYKIADNDSWENFIIRNVNNIKISDDCGQFIQLGHSIGNFIPVPPGFNVGRSNWGKWDSWDLTLTQIYQWYMDNRTPGNHFNNNALDRLFENDRYRQTTVETCQKWLRSFGTWENFVKQNYLESFLDRNGIPKKFFKKHTLDYPLPNMLQECEEFFRTVNECIKNRGKSILRFLHNQGYINDVNISDCTQNTGNEDTESSSAKSKITELKQNFQKNPLDCASYLIGLCARILSIVLAFVYFAQFIVIKKNGYDEINALARTDYLPLERYMRDSVAFLFIILIVFSILLLCISYIKRNRKIKRIAMILITVIISLLCVIPIVYTVLTHIIQNTAWFESWWYSDYTTNMQILHLSIKMYGIVCLIMLAIPACWLIFDSYYKFYMKYLLKSILLTLVLIPLVLGILETKAGAVVFIVIIVIIAIIALKRRCSSCGKIFALKRIGEQSIHKENISVPIKNETKDEAGKVVSTTTQYVPGTRETYDVIYKCKYCGCETRKRKTRDTANL